MEIENENENDHGVWRCLRFTERYLEYKSQTKRLGVRRYGTHVSEDLYP